MVKIKSGDTVIDLNSLINEALDELSNSRYNKVELVDDPKVRSGRAWAKYGGNFPIKRNGKIFYVSRSVAVSMYTYCQNPEGEWCVLANQRGPGAPTNVGFWNTPCGYLDYNESAEDAAVREAFEETGVKIPKSKIRLQGVNSSNFGSSQNVGMRFAVALEGTTDNYPLSAANCEPGEVSDIKWIPLSQVSQYKWCFGQEHKVIEQAKTTLGYENGVINNGLEYKINKLKSELRRNPYLYQLFNQILDELNKDTGEEPNITK